MNRIKVLVFWWEKLQKQNYMLNQVSIKEFLKTKFHKLKVVQQVKFFVGKNCNPRLGNGWVPAYSHNRLTLDHFFAIRPDSHSTISIIAWYLTLKNWKFSVYTRISSRNLTIFEPTRPTRLDHLILAVTRLIRYSFTP